MGGSRAHLGASCGHIWGSWASIDVMGSLFGGLEVYWSLVAASLGFFGALGKRCETAFSHCSTAVKHYISASWEGRGRSKWAMAVY